MSTMALETARSLSRTAIRAVGLFACLGAACGGSDETARDASTECLGAACSGSDETARDASTECASMTCPSHSFWDSGACACVPTVAERCDLDAVLQQRLVGLEAIDCGSVNSNPTRERATAAHDCVAMALANQQPLRLIQMLQGIDSTVGFAYLVDGTGAASVLGYDSDPSGGDDVGGVVVERHCAGLSVRSDAECAPSGEQLCIECDGPKGRDVACREPRP